MSEQAIAKRDKAPIAMTNAGIQFQSFEEAFRLATAIVDSGIAPQGDNAQAVVVKMQAGLELGMTPIQAMQSFVVVNGRLTMYGEAALGKIRASGICEHLVVGNEGEGDARCGFMEFKRRDMPEIIRVTFTVAEAKKAGLWEKKSRSGAPGPWTLYQDDMLVWRAVGRGAKRYMSDVTRGFVLAEVAHEYPPVERVQPQRPALGPGTPDPILAAVVRPSEVELDPETGQPLEDPPQ